MNGVQTFQPGDERAYEAMAQAARKSVSELLIPFKAAADAEGLLRAMSTEEFFKRFIVYADKFTDGCCQDYAKIMRQCAVVPEIRGTPTTSLAKQLRVEVFGPLDAVLTDYIQALRQLEIDLGGVSSELRDSSMVDAAMKGAVIGQLAGGLGSSGRTLGAVNALLQAGVEAEKRLALLQQRLALLKQAESMTFPKIVEYLKAVRELPERLLDYGCAKCFGGQISFERQQRALESISAGIAQELEAAIGLTLALPEAEKRLEQQRLEAIKEKEDEQKKQRELEFQKPNPGCGVLLLAASVGLLIWSLRSCSFDIFGINGVVTEGDAIWGLLLFLAAPVAFVFGIVMFFDRRPKPAASGDKPDGNRAQGSPAPTSISKPLDEHPQPPTRTDTGAKE